MEINLFFDVPGHCEKFVLMGNDCVVQVFAEAIGNRHVNVLGQLTRLFQSLDKESGSELDLILEKPGNHLSFLFNRFVDGVVGNLLLLLVYISALVEVS